MFLSIIIPVYNSQDFLAHCIDSILAQTFGDYEVILVNDGSKDNSQSICEQYSFMHSNIKTYTIENSGSAFARNFGFQKAQGAYVSFIDSDDWIHPTMFETLASIAMKQPFDIVSCDLLHVKANGEEVAEHSVMTGGAYDRLRIVNDIFPYLINSKDLSQSQWPMRMVTKIYNKAFLQLHHVRFADELKAAQDFLFSVSAMYHAHSFYYVKDAFLYNYRENFQSRTHNHLDKAWDNYLILNKHLETLVQDAVDYDFSAQLKLSKLHGVLSSISYMYRDGNTSSFFEKYKHTKKFVATFPLSGVYDLLDWPNLDKKKRLYCTLLRYRQFLLASLLSYVYYGFIYKRYKNKALGEDA